ncbi:hypothetical protein FRB98_001528 [Tulasnella sp. 332]|nr:hypothetical protein FRB98_001528 [Tulasnella sp. 332]
MGISTDGFCPFKRRKQTCWLIIAFNYNLPPKIRFHRSNILCLGVIPGPKQPKDMDSFLTPLINKFLELAHGVAAIDWKRLRTFMLHAYLILAFGDMPAVAKLLLMKGHNGLCPCRACEILGVRDTTSGSTTHYTPLHRFDSPSYNPRCLPLRTHSGLLLQAIHIEEAATDAEAEWRSKKYGIKGVPALSRLSSISLPTSFPHDLMHLLENIIPELVSLWTGDYKHLDTGTESYRIPDNVWKAIGEACAGSGATIPSAFGCRVPNLRENRSHFIAESWMLFASFVGPAVLHRRFTRPAYYKHFISLVQIINLCLEYELTDEMIQQIKDQCIKWVEDFERIYLQYSEEHLPVCTLPIHALLHIAQDIRNMGPMWTYWAFPMERFCGSLLPSIKSRKYPFTSLDHCIQDIAQLDQLKLLYNLFDELDLSDRKDVKIRGKNYDGYPGFIMVCPNKWLPVDIALKKKISHHLITNYGVESAAAASRLIPPELKNWGRLLQVNDGDMIHASDLVAKPDGYRDATYVKC